jgi:hypothetical protein
MLIPTETASRERTPAKCCLLRAKERLQNVVAGLISCDLSKNLNM